MSKYFKALLLLAAGLMILSPIAMAQDAMSVILPAPWTSRLGSQLIYYYEDGVESAARGEYRSFLAVTNTNITTYVTVHVQVYTRTCEEWIDFVDTLTPADTHIYDPRAFKRDWTDQVGGSATNGRYIVTITPIDARGEIYDRRGISFNFLTGQIWTSHFAQSATWMTNAIPRMAVYKTGRPIPLSVIQLGTAWFASNGGALITDATLTLNGTSRMWQVFRPDLLALNRFFAPRDLYQPVPSGDRLSIISFRDDYSPSDRTYRFLSWSNRLDSLLFDDEENVYSIPPQTVACYQEFVVGFDTAGNLPNFIGSSASPTVFNTGGWIRMRPALSSQCSDGSCQAPGSIFGSFMQSLGTFGGGDLLIGMGRRSARFRGDGFEVIVNGILTGWDYDNLNVPILYDYDFTQNLDGTITVSKASATTSLPQPDNP